MADDRFRRHLDQALDRWVLEGLIEESQRQQLRQYYNLDQLNTGAGGRFATVLLSLGAILVGLGIITFIAANWAAIPRGVRALATLGLMIGLQALGFMLWRVPDRLPGFPVRNPQRLGSALLLVGGLVLGAAIALMAQWVQISGSPSGLYLAWSLGLLAMAYGVQHPPSGVVAIVLWLMGFGNADLEQMSFPYLPSLFPLVTLILLGPLAYWCRSRWIFAAYVIAQATAMNSLAAPLQDRRELFLILAGISGAGIWAWSFWHDRWRPWLTLHLGSAQDPGDQAEQQAGLDFAPPAQFLSTLGLISLMYSLGFSGSELNLKWELDPAFQVGTWVASGITLSLFVIAVLGLWIGNHRAQREQATLAPATQTMDRTVALCSLGLVGLVLGTGVFPADEFLNFFLRIIGLNIALFGLGSVIAWRGLQQAQRSWFWLGLLTLTVLVITRFFEYPTGLLVKSVVLVSCGVAVILAGLRFERIHHNIHPQT